MRNVRRRGGLTAVATAAAVAATVVGVAVTTNHDAATAGTGAAPAAASAQQEEEPTVVDGLSERTMASFDHYGTRFTAEDGAKASPAISQQKALETARASLGFTRDAKQIEAAYGVLTVPGYGKELEEDPTKPSRIDPVIKDRPVWLFVFRGVDVPLFGPQTSPEVDAKRPVSINGSAWLAVDAETGEALGGESVQ